jgi:membrane associated rhomboid family serine protease
MIPIRDDAPRSTTPVVNYFLIALNVLVYLFEYPLTNREKYAFAMQFGLVPRHVDGWLSGALPAAAGILPFFTSMFLHGGLWHLLSNMWALVIWGDNVEDRLGHFRYLLFYLTCGLAAGFTQFALNLHSQIPTVGASGAIAGVMGAYFLLFPSARVLTWFGFFIFWLPAWLVLGYWFVLQFLSGAASTLSLDREDGGIAVWAHVGGFIAGVVLIKLMPARRHYLFYEA